MSESDTAPGPHIWVDADAGPVVIKEIPFCAAERARVEIPVVTGVDRFPPNP